MFTRFLLLWHVNIRRGFHVNKHTPHIFDHSAPLFIVMKPTARRKIKCALTHLSVVVDDGHLSPAVIDGQVNEQLRQICETGHGVDQHVAGVPLSWVVDGEGDVGDLQLGGGAGDDGIVGRHHNMYSLRGHLLADCKQRTMNPSFI